MRKMLLLCFVLISTIFYGQKTSKGWEAHFSYHQIVDFVIDETHVYVASENAVFIYNIDTHALSNLTSLDGLAGEPISTITYVKEKDLLLIGYHNGLIQSLYFPTKELLTYSDILEKQSIQSNKKKINHFLIENNLVYVSTDYGISVLNIDRQEFGDTYYIGYLGTHLEVNQTEIFEGYIYAATPGGVKRAHLSQANLVDSSLWFTRKGGNYRSLQKINEQLYVLRESNEIERLEADEFQNIYTHPETLSGLVSSKTNLSLFDSNTLYIYNADFNLVTEYALNEFPSDINFSKVIAEEGVVYMGTDTQGMLINTFSGGQSFQVLPDGPLQNNVFSVDAQDGALWASYGAVNYSFNPYPLQEKGVSRFKENQWYNIPYKDLQYANSLVNIKINPSNTEEVFFNSYQQGLLRLFEETPVSVLNHTNSSLELAKGSEAYGVRLYGLDFDKEANLWFTQSGVKNGLHKLAPNGKLTSFSLEGILAYNNELALTDLVVSEEGLVFFGTAENGLIAYHPGLNKFRRIQAGTAGGFPENAYIYSLAIDQQSRLWIGTGRGLRVVQNLNRFFEDAFELKARQIIIMDDELPQELLFDVPINSIHVDGANNKWIATATSGAFYISANGQRTIYHFTKENSALPSNDVQDVSIDPATGKVYFATTNGLVSYQGAATATQENLESLHAFPNPVRPGFEGNITIAGLMENTNVKITDLEGNLVFEARSQGGTLQWDTRAFGKHKVASGVYFIMANAKNGETTKIAKIMIIR